ncbi:hypothetical protein GFY24_33360 [Nocardia sp. SYP-A9097]|uniref:hypothetical protein n=1 Tax=Nocardia sp. SYP-A9097 TaxID=2663237 RepID=UPI00129A70D6|nr:hypothetical protein [Nocardia sp. SYP-A9097]MRH92267.1 hypothetical protein [Nocardia sp. SYP-A9097]
MTSNTTAGRIHRVADVLPGLTQRANWSAVRALFSQQVQQIDSGGRYVPDSLAGAFADALERVSPSYAMDYGTMCLHALTALADEEGMEYLDIELFRRYYEFDILSSAPALAADPRWRPGTGEAIVETCRRLRDVHCLRAVLHHKGSSGLLIGSMNYGRYYNVRGNRYGERASDLDLIIVVDTASDLIALADALAGVRCVRSSDVDRFRQRAEVFIGELDDECTVFSHKVRLWSDGVPDPMLPREIAAPDYMLSIHVMTPPVLKYALVGSTPDLLRPISGRRRTLRDNRESRTDRWDDVLDFAGRRDRADLDEVEARNGWLRSPRCYYIDDQDCYYPGFFQSMLMPGPEVLWDDRDIRFPLAEFRHKLEERRHDEASRRRPAMLRLSFAHIRRAEFAPSVIRALDGPYSGY